PSGTLTVKVVGGKELRGSGSGSIDPYVTLRTGGGQLKEVGEQKFKTPSHRDGGADPQWNYDVRFEVVDQVEIEVKCWDKDLLSKDDLIGEGKVCLRELFDKAATKGSGGSGRGSGSGSGSGSGTDRSASSSAMTDVWVPLTHNSGVPAGEVHLVLFFVGPVGVEYPLCGGG
ncbi:hypothetical protein ScalyP_jg10959, partial [Parmales sp. scaly parma]